MPASSLADIDMIGACRRGNADMFKQAVKDGANLNASDGAGRVALMHAAAQGHSSKEGADKVLELLINAKAALDLNCDQGWTAIHYAVVNEQEAAVQRLIYARVDPEEKNLAGKDPLDLATDLGLVNMANLLKSKDEIIARYAKKNKK